MLFALAVPWLHCLARLQPGGVCLPALHRNSVAGHTSYNEGVSCVSEREHLCCAGLDPAEVLLDTSFYRDIINKGNKVGLP